MKNKYVTLVILMLGLSAASLAQATDWSADEYDLYSGDFNGDGKGDILYVAKDPAKISGIAISDGSAPNITWQTWPSNFLGIPWSGNQYNVIVADFNGDGKADILLQKVSAGDHYLLLSDSGGKIVGISQTIANGALGVTWSADQHKLLAGDINNDGKADLFMQATNASGINAVAFTDSYGTFTTSPTQSWNDGYLGLNWSTQSANVFIGDFNGDHLADLLVQAKPKWVMIDYDVTFPVPTYPPNMNGIAYSQGGAAPYQLSGVQTWSRMNNGVDWSPLTNTLLVGDFDGDGRGDILFQAKYAGTTSYILNGNASGAAFGTATAITSSTVPLSSDSNRLVVGNFDGGAATGLYIQAPTAAGTNYVANSVGTTVTAATHNPNTATGTSPATAVGHTVGSFAVSNTGAATYSIPIAVPPGVSGVQPGLAIAYQSGSGNGLLGVGWGISGLSEIDRCSKTPVQDGTAGAVTLTASDVYCLDGNKLRLTSGTYGAASSTYQTEMETFSRITASATTAGNGPAYFTVEAKNGLIYEYGNSSDSRIESLNPSATTTPRTWALNKVSDRTGNTMTISYQEDGSPAGSYRPSQVLYTSNSNAGLAAAYRVQFYYDTRPDPIQGYIAGGVAKENYRLNRVETQYNDPVGGWRLVRKYQLSYNNSSVTQRSRLMAVQECDRNGYCLSPTNVSWQSGQVGFGAEKTAANLGSLSANAMPMDINGDGRTDVVYPCGNNWCFMLAGIDANGNAVYGSPVDTSIAHNNVYSSALQLDYNLDGKADLLVPDASGNWQVLQSTGNGFTVISTGYPATGAGGQAWVADTNGDGWGDLLYISGQNLITRIGSATGFSSNVTTLYTLSYMIFSTNTFDSAAVARSTVAVADFNGDGKADIEVIGFAPLNPTWRLFLLSNSGSTYDLYQQQNLGGWGSAEAAAKVSSIRSLDLNGDGIADVVYACPSTNTWCVQLGTHSGLSAMADTGIGWDLSYSNIIATDWDGDGKGDLLFSSTTGNWQLLRATGDPATPFSAPVDTGIPVGNLATIGDVNGDAQFDVLYADSSNNWHYRLHNGGVPDLVTAVSDGFGNNVNVTYAPLTDSSVYTKGSGASFPEIDMQAPMYVVKKYTTNDGLGGSYDVTENYTGARVHVQGRGFEGFSSRSETDGRTGVVARVDLRQDFPYTGSVSYSRATASDGTIISETTNSYSQLVTNATQYADRHYPFVSTSVQKTNEIGGTANGLGVSQVTSTIDLIDTTYGTPTQVTKTTADLTGSGQTFTTRTNNTIVHDATNWCLGFVTQQQVTNTVPGLAAQVRTVQTVKDSANPSLCRASQQIVEPGNAYAVTTTFGYDSFGHVNSQTVAGTGITNRVTTTSYGAQGVFPLSVTNAENETAYKSYDYALGVPLTATDANNISISWQYDGFGRKTRENRPDGTATTWALASCGIGNAFCGDSVLRYQVQEAQLDTSGAAIRSGTTMYDAMARPVYTLAQTLSGATSVVKTVYNNKGQVVQRSMPYFSGFAPTYTTYTYDLLNRPLTEARPISDSNAGTQSNQYTYTRLVNAFTDANGKVTTKYFNALGQTVQVQDPGGGNTYYTYDPFGNLLTTTDPLNNKIVNTFNIRGFKMTTSDPDMGNWTYDYFPTGELKSQTDAKTQTATFTYDKVARPKTRIEPEGTTTWTYGATLAQKNIGKLVSVASPNSYSESYTYDSLGRPQDVTTVADATTFVVSNSYQATTGLLDTVTYPTSTTAVPNSRFKVQYDYAYGLLKAVKDFNSPSTIYWQQIATNAAGQTIDEQFGNGLHSYTTYDSINGRLGARTTGATAQVQNLSYQWDNVGNLTERKDQRQNFTEDFYYDARYRLDHSTLTSGGTTITNLTMGYDASGNITSKSDVGSYAYPASGTSSVRPHAVSTAGTNSYSYDADGNMTLKNGDAITWYSYNLPNRINKGSNYAQFSYGAGRQRYKQVAVSATGGNLPAGTETTLYVGSLFEQVTKPSGVIEYKHYLMAGKEPIAIKTIRSNSANDVRYLHKDHLGSVDAITDESGNVVTRMSFDAFGKRRSASAWAGALTAADWTSIAAITHRAFTFHEQLDNVDMVHMNGRVYDPTIGRFISADPTIQAPFMSQSLNRYSYVMNNPLSLIDPSGFSWLSKALKSVGHFISKYWKPIVAIAIAYFTGVWVSNLAGGGLTGAIAGGAAGGFVGGAVGTALAGGNLSDVLRAGIIGGITGAVMGGIGYKLAGALHDQAVLNSFKPDLRTAIASTGLAPLSTETLSEVVITATRWIESTAAAAAGAGAAVASGVVAVAGVLYPSSTAKDDTVYSSAVEANAAHPQYVYHYTNTDGALGIANSGVINPSGDGFTYVTNTVYPSGSMAQIELDLRITPVGYFEIPYENVAGRIVWGPVTRINGFAGLGWQGKVLGPVSIGGGRFVPIGP